MPSLGEAPITCGSQTIGKASVKHVYAYPAVNPCLGVTVGVALYHLSERLSQQQPPLRDYEIHDLNGTIGIGDAHTIVGTVNWIGPNRYVRSSDFPSDYDLTFTCDLDFGLLERMESIRGRNAPRFWLSLWPTVVHAGGFLRVEFGQVDFVVPRDTWIDALKKIRGDRYEIIEVRLDMPSSSEYQKAIAHTQTARAAIDQGRYDSAVAQCRQAVEALALGIGLTSSATPEQWSGALAKRTQPRCGEEYGRIIARLKQLAGFAIHDMNQPAPDYSRREALFITRLTESCVALVSDLSSPS
jgi:hypothetical protein